MHRLEAHIHSPEPVMKTIHHFRGGEDSAGRNDSVGQCVVHAVQQNVEAQHFVVSWMGLTIRSGIKHMANASMAKGAWNAEDPHSVIRSIRAQARNV
jgi:hypothetical protein